MFIVGEIRIKEVLTYWACVSPKVVLTEERVAHIRERHCEDYELYGKYIQKAIDTPDFVLDDKKNTRTALFILHIDETNLNVVVRLVHSQVEDMESSVITLYRVGEKRLQRLLRNNFIVYKKT